MQHPDFCSEDYSVKVFQNGDLKNLDLLLGHQVSGSLYPSVKDEVERLHLQEHGSMPQTQGTCQLVLRTAEKSGNMLLTLWMVEWIVVNRQSRQRENYTKVVQWPQFLVLGSVVPPVLHITSGIVLKMFNMLVSVEPRNNESYRKWREKYE